MIALYEVYHIEHFKNLVLFVAWSVTIMCSLCLCVSDEVFAKVEDNTTRLASFFCFIFVMSMASVGWTLTAAFFALAWVALKIKVAEAREETSKKAAAQGSDSARKLK